MKTDEFKINQKYLVIRNLRRTALAETRILPQSLNVIPAEWIKYKKASHFSFIQRQQFLAHFLSCQ